MLNVVEVILVFHLFITPTLRKAFFSNFPLLQFLINYHIKKDIF